MNVHVAINVTPRSLTCPLHHFKYITKLPTSTPVTPAPTKVTVTSTPTKAPVITPTTGGNTYCQDNDEKFKFNGKSRHCKFISKKAGNRCSSTVAAENCPVTCETDCTAYDTKDTFFTRGIEKNCKWAGNRPKRCNRNDVRSNCPLTCGVNSVEEQGLSSASSKNRMNIFLRSTK